MKATLVDIQPVSTYQGKVYTQDIFLKVASGTELRVSDANMYCDDSLIDRKVDVKLKASDVEKVNEINYEEYRLTPHGKTCGITILRGKISNIYENTAKKYVIGIDVGCGLICCHIFKNDAPNFSPEANSWVELKKIMNVYLKDVEVLEK
ncbi:hypothetical protein [Natronorubrum sp. DTA28]|uniref:hypothetical protein n=1 Tax=Natronorubrum sp. DTA28 TaxID=3447019 RepID=UPI003F8733B2